MKRREALLSLGALGAGAALSPVILEATKTRELSVEQVEELLRAFAGVEPLPGEAARIREALAAFRVAGETDPRVQPALGFNPEVEL